MSSETTETVPSSNEDSNNTTTPWGLVNTESTVHIETEHEENPERKLSFDDSRPMTVREINNKILGLIYGCIVGDIYCSETNKMSYSSDQIIIMINTIAERGLFDILTFTQLLKLHSKKGFPQLKDHTVDIPLYVTDVTNDKDYLSNPSVCSYNLYMKERNNENEKYYNTPLIRAAFAGIFKDRSNYSVAQ